jgi:hypothetical protein
MHLRTLAAFILLSFVLALAPVRPVHAALAEELSEVTRLHHAGQSEAALERADRFLAGKPEGRRCASQSVVLADSSRRSEPRAVAADLSGLSRTGRSRTTTSPALPCRPGDYARPGRSWKVDPPPNPTLRDGARNLGDVHAACSRPNPGRAQRLEPGNTGLPRKLELVRQLAGPRAGSRPAVRPQARMLTLEETLTWRP